MFSVPSGIVLMVVTVLAAGGGISPRGVKVLLSEE